MSRLLTRRQVKAVIEIGDILLPGNQQLPPFSKVFLSHQVDPMLEHLYSHDRQGLLALLSVLSFFPRPLLHLFIELADKGQSLFFIAPLFRMLTLGLRGLIYTPYYANLNSKYNIHQTIGWEVNMETVTQENSNEVQLIYKKAREAQSELQQLSIKEKIQIIKNLKKLIIQREQEIIEMIQHDTGKSRYDALVSEVFAALEHLHFLKDETPKKLKGETIKTPIAMLGKKSKVFLSPLGTVLVISPWNYPFYQAIVPITQALVMGNAVIYKPSEFTPLTGLIESLLEQAGVKKDWVQIAYGDGHLGEKLIDQRPDKIFFTGSVETGKKIMAQAARHLIPVELELGGKDAMIVFDDVSVERAVAGALWGALTNTGQSCTSVERLYVHQNIYDQFRESLLQKMRQITSLTTLRDHADLGRMTTQSQINIVAEQLKDAQDKGARIVGAENWDQKDPMVPAILIDQVTEEMKVYREETFGPLIVMTPFQSQQEVIDKVNSSEYGLAASVWSKDKNRALEVSQKLHVGNVSINNVMLSEGNHYLPFGGVKNSGFGRFKGRWGFEAFSNIKSVLIDSDSKKIEPNWYPYDETKYTLFSRMSRALFSGGIINFLKFAFFGLRLESYSDKLGKKEKWRD